MSFFNYLQSNDLFHLINEQTFSPKLFKGSENVYRTLDLALQEQYKTLVIGDYDVDGCCSAMIMYESLVSVGMENVDVFKYTNRTHKLGTDSVLYAIKNNYKLVIILDTGSSDLQNIELLEYYGLEVIIIDHHQTDIPQDRYVLSSIINSTFEDEKILISAGALTFCVMYNYFIHRKLKTPDHLSTYALISLYADCIDMTSELNIAIYHLCNSIPKNDYPFRVKLLMGNYTKLSRRAIEYSISPVMNACFRGEVFTLLNKFFLDKNTTVLQASDILLSMKEVHRRSADMVSIIGKLIQKIGVKEISKFVIFDLAKIDINEIGPGVNLGAYTGLIANNLTSTYKKTAIVYYSGDGVSIKGSVRDFLSRDYLTLFKQICEAGGHNPAFGFYIRAFELNQFLKSVDIIDRCIPIEAISSTNVLIKNNGKIADETEVNEMALYNEFSGTPDVPRAIMLTNLNYFLKPTYSKVYTSYKWGNFTIDSPYKLESFNNVLLLPTLTNTLKLKVQNL